QNDLIQRQIRLLLDQTQQRIRMLLQWRDAPAPQLGRAAASLAKALDPDNRCAGADLKLFGCLAPRSSALHLRYHSLPHVPRISLRHRPASPNESMPIDSLIFGPLRIPRFNQGGTCSSCVLPDRTVGGAHCVLWDRTHGRPFPGPSCVLWDRTGCPVGQDGLLFFSGRTTRLIGEQFAGPFFIITRGWVRSMREVGEAEFCGKAIGIDAQKSLPRPAQKTIMLQLEVLLLDGVAVDADRVCCVAARA